jgi:thiol:disulfide interchange protein
MKHLILFVTAMLFAMTPSAEQFKAFGDIEVHYAVVNTLFLQPDVAARYNIARDTDRAIVNVSVVNHDGGTLAADLSGVSVNLLNQEAKLTFDTIKEDESTYYIAALRYTDQDVLRFRITVKLPGRDPMNVEFQQLMYVAP